VVCDRFVDATLAYQGGGRGLEQDKLATLARWVLGSLKPDLTLLFDAPVALALQRLRSATPNPDRFEREESEFFDRVRSSYLGIARDEPGRVKIIDATQGIADIHEELEILIASI